MNKNDIVCGGTICKKATQCERFVGNVKPRIMPLYQYIDYSTYGCGATTNRGYEITYYCGDYGNYKMFIQKQKEDKMQQAEVKKLDNGNRLLVPTKYLQELGVEKNGTVLVVKDSNEDCIKIFKVEE